jgi:hypothetical protein
VRVRRLRAKEDPNSLEAGALVLRITAGLMSKVDRANLWSETSEIDVGNHGRAERDLVGAITRAVRAAVIARESRIAVKKRK